MKYFAGPLTAILSLLAAPALAVDCPMGERAVVSDALVGGSACIPDSPERLLFAEDGAVVAYLLEMPVIGYNWSINAFLEVYPGAATDRIDAMTDRFKHMA
mgnify:CR=1 FL=1